MSAAIRTDALTKDYAVGFWRKRPYRALDALTLEIETGEVFGFLGPNGAGKTTTLKLLMQLIFRRFWDVRSAMWALGNASATSPNSPTFTTI